jgi:hypothetical protein
VSPGAGVKAGRRPPVGLGLDTGEDDATLPKPEAGHDPKTGIRKDQPEAEKITWTRKDQPEAERSAGP